MIVVDTRYFQFKISNVFFSDHIFDIDTSDSVIFHYCDDLEQPKGFTQKKTLTSIIDVSQDTADIWNTLHRKVRQKITRAEKAGIKIQYNNNYAEFFDLYKQFRRKKNFGIPYYYEFPDIDFLKKNGLLLTGYYDNTLLGGALYYYDDNNIICWFMASNRLESSPEKARMIGDSSHLLTWEAIKYANSKGIKKWNWGGIWSEDHIRNDATKSGINRFKLSFGGQVVTYFRYEKVYSPVYSAIKRLYFKLL